MPADAHGCPACPHPCIGPAIAGSPDVMVNNLPALRVGDPGMHAACCGPNTWTAQAGSGTVFINSIKAHRLGDKDTHCGGSGQMVDGSSNVDGRLQRRSWIAMVRSAFIASASRIRSTRCCGCWKKLRSSAGSWP